tara:strand:+ start:486 stop:590 length:105 start_codon:yes stop_codon:yes gene_type:complete
MEVETGFVKSGQFDLSVINMGGFKSGVVVCELGI